MKIKITGSSSDSYWYANKIGEVFEVLKEEESAYKVGYRWVQKTDCIPYKEEPKEEPKEDQLYICDHAEECNQNCTSGVAHIKTTGCGCNSCNFFDEPVKCIPYKEEPEGSEYIHIADGLEDEKSEPKTKRVGVIWFGEVPVDKCENPIISDEMTGYVYDQVELIDPDRLRYGVPEKGDVICDVRGTKLRSTYEPGAFRLIIDPPTPEPQEAVDDVLERMPNPKNYQDPISGVINLRGYYNAMKSCFKDLKAAQEREEKS